MSAACSDVAWPKHQKMCTAEKPFRMAGTGLGKESLSTKLVPGKIAGSMHSNLSPTKEVSITASSQADDLPTVASLNINKQVQLMSALRQFLLSRNSLQCCVVNLAPTKEVFMIASSQAYNLPTVASPDMNK